MPRFEGLSAAWRLHFEWSDSPVALPPRTAGENDGMRCVRGSFPVSHAVSHAVFRGSTRAIQSLESEADWQSPLDSDVVQFLIIARRGNLPRSHTQRSSGVQSLHQLWRNAAGQRDTVRGVRAKTQQVASILSVTFRHGEAPTQ